MVPAIYLNAKVSDGLMTKGLTKELGTLCGCLLQRAGLCRYKTVPMYTQASCQLLPKGQNAPYQWLPGANFI